MTQTGNTRLTRREDSSSKLRITVKIEPMVCQSICVTWKQNKKNQFSVLFSDHWGEKIRGNFWAPMAPWWKASRASLTSKSSRPDPISSTLVCAKPPTNGTPPNVRDEYKRTQSSTSITSWIKSTVQTTYHHEGKLTDHWEIYQVQSKCKSQKLISVHWQFCIFF